jgi:hypothetical protein
MAPFKGLFRELQPQRCLPAWDALGQLRQERALRADPLVKLAVVARTAVLEAAMR